MNFKKEIKKNKGITLIALVVTIIVLLILAGISIAMLTGQNGILNRAAEAKNSTETAQTDEQVKLSVAEALSNGLGKITEENLREALNNNVGAGKYELTGDAINGWTIKAADKTYNISGNGSISGGEDEDPLKPSDYNIYVYLYDDGTLSLGRENESIPNKKVLKEYGNIKDENYTSELIDGNMVANTPWFEERESIKNVIILSEIYPKNTANWFAQCSNLNTINNIEKLETEYVTDMSYMFQNCINISSLDVSSFDTSNVTDMSFMFAGRHENKMSLTEIKGLEKFNTSKVTNMSTMFQNCINLLSLDVSSFDTSNVTDMSYMFAGGNENKMSLTEIKGLEKFNTSKVTNMSTMFYNCVNLSSLDVSNFDTSNVTDMSFMFTGGYENKMSLTEIKGIEKFNTSKVTNMKCMFQNCINLSSLDLSSFDTSNVTDMSYMFSQTKNLKNIYVGPNWTMKNVTSSNYMYSNSGVSSTTTKS